MSKQTQSCQRPMVAMATTDADKSANVGRGAGGAAAARRRARDRVRTGASGRGTGVDGCRDAGGTGRLLLTKPAVASSSGRSAGGWRYYTREEHADLITRYVTEGQQSKLSQAALETLAVVVYTQPISRGRVSAVRGVNVDGVMRTLLARGLIEEAGHDPESGAVLFATTSYFLERMGLKSLDELPPLAPQLPEVEELEAELGQLADAASTRTSLKASASPPEPPQ